MLPGNTAQQYSRTGMPVTPTPIASSRLHLVPVLASHAGAMYPVLYDRDLYSYTGGEPPKTESDVEAWFSALETRQSPDGRQQWLTWIVELSGRHDAIGYVQATITEDSADVAWLIGLDWQQQGYASEAASTLVPWLLANGVTTIRAYMHPRHEASQKVARAAGLAPTGKTLDGEEVWRLGG
jgi:RimJ/RimL family protein N-acetyltransferase